MRAHPKFIDRISFPHQDPYVHPSSIVLLGGPPAGLENRYAGKKPFSFQRHGSACDLGTASECFKGVAEGLRTSLKLFEGSMSVPTRPMLSQGMCSTDNGYRWRRNCRTKLIYIIPWQIHIEPQSVVEVWITPS
jgi:hypothetical protein